VLFRPNPFGEGDGGYTGISSLDGYERMEKIEKSSKVNDHEIVVFELSVTV
jgi:hypothetical protein